MRGRGGSRRAGLCAALLLVLAPPALAAFPDDPPNDPSYDSVEDGYPSSCTQQSVNDEQHYFYSFLPRCAPGASDPEGASGMSVDRAWREFTTGRADTVIAYIEAGINWRNEPEELADRVFLNKGELPAPTTPDGDRSTLNARDYADTKDANDNGVVDPEDIIVRFSDGRDDDHNRYVDDISGWDFYDDQNDPATVDSAYDHANGQQRQAAAETNNGIHEAGLCPRCMLLPVKAGAEALDRTDDLAQAWLYASDMNADVIVSVTADLGYSSFMRQAVERVWRRGTVMVEASNDFDSLDHQGGMFWPHVLPGNGLVANSQGVPGPPSNAETTTYRVRSGLTSWGTHNVFSAATVGGSTSESTPTVGGVMALVIAYGKDAAHQGRIARPLTNAEAIQVVRATSSDVADPSLPWPGKPGWDMQYGYGRPNAYRAMQAISQGDIPPVGWIDSPRWYSLYDPEHTSKVPITGHVEARRSARYRWTLEYGLGPEPSDSGFQTLRSGGGHRPFDGHLGTLDLSDIPESFWTAQFNLSSTKTLETNDQYTVTLRLRVTDADGRVGEERRAIAVHHDPSLLRGFPHRIGPGGEAQATLADLQGTGHLAAVFGDSDGVVHAIDGRTGHELPGWPAKTDRTAVTRSHRGVDPGHEPVFANAAVGDLDHDGRQWVVIASSAGRVYVFDGRGHRRHGWPKRLGRGAVKPQIPRPDMPFTRLPHQGASAPPVLYDLDGDGKLEVVEAAWNGYLYAWRPSGHRLPGWPVEVKLPDGHPSPAGRDKLINDHKLVTPPAIADLDGDGKPELLIRSQWAHIADAGIQPGGVGHVHAYHADGSPVSGYPVEQESIVMYYGSAQEFITEGSTVPSVANVDGAGGDEWAEGPIFTPTSLYRGDGTPMTAYGSPGAATSGITQVLNAPLSVLKAGHVPADVPVTFTASGGFGRFGAARHLVFAQPGSGGSSIIAALLLAGSGFPINNVLRVNDALSGADEPGFSAVTQGLDFLGAPAIADVSGDGNPEILEGGDSSALHGFSTGGDQAPGFPKFHTGWVVYAPTTGDLDGDGRTDVVVVTREGYVMAWGTQGTPEGNQEWWDGRHDERNTSRYGFDTRPPGALRKLELTGGGAQLEFRAPGDDWYAGKVDHYLVRFYVDAGKNKPVSVDANASAGEQETVQVPTGTRRIRIQAVDDAGNLSRPRAIRVGGG